ncbi:MAG: carboxymuconolactone decarboxylase family protein [Simkaniaceae bacterium]|nr:carboxymuconolactone decarboxylase family protein [Simkaniaceae bacterium]
MSRITPKAKNTYPWYLKLLFYLQKKKYGAILEPVLLWGRTPRVFLGFLLMQKSLNRKNSPLPPDLRALVTIRISQINQCAFCIDMNSSLLLQRGGREEQILNLSLFQQSSLFTESEKVALEYAEVVTQSPNKVNDELFQKLKAHFEEDAIVELTALIAFQSLSSQFNSALDASEFGFCKTFKKST